MSQYTGNILMFGVRNVCIKSSTPFHSFSSLSLRWEQLNHSARQEKVVVLLLRDSLQ